MFVLGIDPGLSRCGYACIEALGHQQVRGVAMGVLRTSKAVPLPLRLASMRLELAELMSAYRPQVVVVEHVFFQTNVRTATSVAQVSGIAMAEAVLAEAEVVQYTPNQVKHAVTGFGAADKKQVQRMVQARLGLRDLPKPADAADAAALALCHLAFAPLQRRMADVR